MPAEHLSSMKQIQHFYNRSYITKHIRGEEFIPCDMREDFAPPDMHVTREELELFHLAARLMPCVFWGTVIKLGKG